MSLSSSDDLPGNDHAASTDKVTARDLLAPGVSLPAWSELVRPDRPAELEIGSGKGLYLQNAAAERPGHDFVGVELSGKFANRAAQRLAKRSLDNVVMLRGDAGRFVAEAIPDQSVHAAHVYFPDPWWRNKHKKRRVLNETMLENLVRILLPGGKFHFWTDVADYYEHICALVMDTTPLLGPEYVPSRDASHSMDYTTHFERRARLNSQPVYRAIFRKPG